MGRDEYYAQVNHLTEAAMEKLSLLTPGLTDFLLAHFRAIRQAGEEQLSDGERISLINLSFFYFLGTCIDFLFFLHLRQRGVQIYEHELEHVLGIMMTHAKHQREEFMAGTNPPTDPAVSGTPGAIELHWGESERELQRYGEALGGGGGCGSAP